MKAKYLTIIISLLYRIYRRMQLIKKISLIEIVTYCFYPKALQIHLDTLEQG